MSDKFYITTAIDYPNSRPHIGTAFEKIGADVQARFRRMLGQEVYFLMGNDENTFKVAEKAKELKVNPYEYCDHMAEGFLTAWRALNISFDNFIQTSKVAHRWGVKKFIQHVYDGGYIYKKKYTADYCTGCEEFKTASSLEDGKCPNHPNMELAKVEEENWFFKVQPFLGPCRVQLDRCFPEYRKNELEILLKSAEDVSISRPNKGWGIEVPWDKTQVIYVWFDALINYLTGIGYGTDEEMFRKWWPATHIVGKDITRFHCSLWPAMLYAYNNSPEMQADRKKQIPMYNKVFSHGFVKVKGAKVSKTGVFVDPMDIVKEYGADAYRYYFMSKCPFGGDGDYDPDHFKEAYNAELANNLGNLVSRVYTLIAKYGTAGYGKPKQWFEDVHGWRPFTYAMYEYNYRGALQQVWQILDRANEHLEHHKPWDKNNVDKRSDVLRNVAVCLRVVATLITPFMPDTAARIRNIFNFPDVKFNELWADNYVGVGEILVANEKPEPLFPRKK